MQNALLALEYVNVMSLCGLDSVYLFAQSRESAVGEISWKCFSHVSMSIQGHHFILSTRVKASPCPFFT
jgi:hypothetical protein